MEEYEESERYLLKSLAIKEELVPLDHAEVAKTYELLGKLYISIGDMNKAEEY